MLKSILTSAVLCAAMLATGCSRDAGASGAAEKPTDALAQKLDENTYVNAQLRSPSPLRRAGSSPIAN
jgi:hypothetical protein